MIVCVACGPNLELPQALLVDCTTSADCPAPLTCQPVALRCVDPTSSDRDPPTMLSANAPDDTHVAVQLSEAILSSTSSVSSYAIDPPLQIYDAIIADNLREVDLTVDPQVPGDDYTVTVSGLADLLGNVMTAPSSQTFTGFGASPDRSPPDIIAPAKESVVSATIGALLVWSRRAQARTYTVDVATDADFTQPIAGSPFLVNDPENSTTVMPAQAVRYYWRVRANTTTPDSYGSSTFNVVGDAIHVSCPSAGCSDTGAAGNPSAPYATINAAVIAAESSHLSLIRVAAGTYNEGVSIAGLTLEGGYSADFSTRNRTTYVTTLSNATAPALLVVGTAASSSISGFTLQSGADTALAIQGVVTGKVQITDNTIGGASTAVTIADTDITDTTLVNLSGNIIQGASSAIGMQGAAATLTGNTLSTAVCSSGCLDVAVVSIVDGAALLQGNGISSGATAANVTGVFVSDSQFEMRSNDVRPGPTVFGSNYALRVISTASVAPSIIANNIFGSGDAQQFNGCGNTISTPSDVVIVNNAFWAGYCTDADALDIAMMTKAIIVNNMFFATSVPTPGTFRECISENGSAVNVTDLHDNLFAGCPQALYHDLNTGADLLTLDDLNTASKTTQGAASTDGGNIILSDLSDIHFAGFPANLHLMMSTPSPVYDGGHNTDTATCGAGANESCGGVASDFDNATRTCPSAAQCFSIGPYEYDQ